MKVILQVEETEPHNWYAIKAAIESLTETLSTEHENYLINMTAGQQSFKSCNQIISRQVEG